MGPSIFRIEIRDPGDRSNRRPVSSVEAAAQPLTRLAAEAIAAGRKGGTSEQEGVILEPYRNYRGARVVGAWNWLPAYSSTRRINELFGARPILQTPPHSAGHYHWCQNSHKGLDFPPVVGTMAMLARRSIRVSGSPRLHGRHADLAAVDGEGLFGAGGPDPGGPGGQDEDGH